jgi:hypothetical protein
MYFNYNSVELFIEIYIEWNPIFLDYCLNPPLYLVDLWLDTRDRIFSLFVAATTSIEMIPLVFF